MVQFHWSEDESVAFRRSKDEHGALLNMMSGFPLTFKGIEFSGPKPSTRP